MRTESYTRGIFLCSNHSYSTSKIDCHHTSYPEGCTHEQGLATMHHVYTPPQRTRQGYVSPSLRNMNSMYFWSTNLVPVIESPVLSSNPPTSSDLPSAVSLPCFAFPSLTHSVYLGELLHEGLSERQRCKVGSWFRCADEAFIHCLLLHDGLSK